MIDLQQIQILAQLSDNLENLTKNLEESYNKNDSDGFNKCKKELIGIQNKIAGVIKNKS